MYVLYNCSWYFKFEPKYQKYRLFFQIIFPILVAMFLHEKSFYK